MVARGMWLAVASMTLAFYVADVWVRIVQFRGPCLPGLCIHGQTPPAIARAFADLHLSISFYGWYGLGRDILFAAGFATVAAIIVWRRSYDPLALLVSLALLAFGAGSFEGGLLLNGLPILNPGWRLPVELLMFLGEALLAIFTFIFPNGRFVPRWTSLAAAFIALCWLPDAFVPGTPLDFITWPGATSLCMWALILGAMVTAQIYRYRHVSTPQQRQQTKWVVFGSVAAAVGYLSGRMIIFFLAPALTSPRAILADLAGYTLNYASLLLVPICIGIAMLRHHLFDIDVIIRRTLIYTILTSSLALVFFCCVIAAQAVVQAMWGARQPLPPLVVVASTLLIAALFTPLRRRTQHVINRRFYRRRYDAAKLVAAFGANLKMETDVDSLRAHLLAAVEETMQPAHVSLWLRSAESASEVESIEPHTVS